MTILKNMLQIYKEDFINFYFVYRGIKKGYYDNDLSKHKLNNMILLCKKLKLNYIYIKHDNVYHILISKYKIKEKSFYFKKNGKLHNERIGLFLGFPKKCCVKFNFKKKQQKYLHKIDIEFVYKGKNGKNKRMKQNILFFYCDKKNISYLKKMKLKIKNEIKKNLSSIIYAYRLEVCVCEGINL